MPHPWEVNPVTQDIERSFKLEAGAARVLVRVEYFPNGRVVGQVRVESAVREFSCRLQVMILNTDGLVSHTTRNIEYYADGRVLGYGDVTGKFEFRIPSFVLKTASEAEAVRISISRIPKV
jgi:hypothetical protein